MSGRIDRPQPAIVGVILGMLLMLAGCAASDADLEAALIVRLAMNPRTAAVEARVQDRVARLAGETDTRDAQREAETIARSVPGIRAVVGAMRLSDASIRRAVQDALAREPMLAGIEIEVTVHRGVVRLEGGGTDRVLRARAIGTTAQVDGVIRIEDYMR